MALKHVGRDAKTHRKVIVAYRVVPGEPDNCLIIKTESLDAASHDSLMTAVESNAGQNAYEFAEAMFRNTLPDGLNMLQGMQKYGKMVKVPTDQVEMTPNTRTTIPLSDLIQAIAQQKGVAAEDLANVMQGQPVAKVASDTPVTQAPTSTDGVLTDEELATQYRSQADAMFKEAKRLREQAEDLVPTKRKVKTKTEESA